MPQQFKEKKCLDTDGLTSTHKTLFVGTAIVIKKNLKHESRRLTFSYAKYGNLPGKKLCLISCY